MKGKHVNSTFKCVILVSDQLVIRANAEYIH